jgi:hypothetical protein
VKKRTKKRRPTADNVRNISEYFELPFRDQQRREKAFRALSLMRLKGLSREAAAREAGITTRSVQKIVGSALQKSGSRYKPAKGDRFLRIMQLPAAGGRIELEVRGSRNASRVSAYDRAVKHFIYTGDPSLLQGFEGQAIVSKGQRVPLLTDQRVLDRLARAHAISFESIYAVAV